MIEYPNREQLASIFEYDPDTGIVTGKESRGNRKAGKAVGHKCTGGYLQVRLNGKNLSVARIAFIMAFGTSPAQIDHINRIRDDNRICNLRESCQTRNARNKKVARNNTSGRSGVSFDKQSGLWKVRIGTGNGRKTVGMFRLLDDAVAARTSAEASFWYAGS